ncbi:MAG: putative metalloprotease CJM1_0395 family protein [Dissulfurimicrobium sp.]|uniref:putative metalloprotease CJM1_0395 family protein n=1 Tax=Dissulfurimicrobium TaxID=1769732 RepID=UPI001EDB801D|nr:putative metalloprotease CJM1_0395 family protein [Dissulfurimicrobium hydrothermale]UKL13492.1 protein-glutamate O-methyltransferase [Dissulfurimicrobium hydrothermale]
MKIDQQNQYQIYEYNYEPNSRGNDRSGKGEIGFDRKAVGDRVRQQDVERVVQQLKMTEQKVIAHEMAHKVVGGNYAGAVSYEYRVGPDGRLYIVGGEVPIDVSDGISPEDTVRKMEQVRMAALAPIDPSPQDYRVAQEALMKEAAARQEIIKAEMENKAMKYKKNNAGTNGGDSRAGLSLYV